MTLFARLIGICAATVAWTLFVCSSATAQICNVSIDQMNFGTLRVTDLGTTGATATLTADCTGQPTDTIRLCPTMQSGTMRHAQDGGNQLHLTLYSDPGYQTPLASGIDIALDGSGNGHATLALYGRMSRDARAFKGGQYQTAINLVLVGTYLSSEALCSSTAGARRLPAVTRGSVKAVAAKR